ncbi:MAG: DNA polymerase III subunit alpha, partial [bacterium]|nr:DNA polymerase III subunit alpha [bacterium]
AAQDAGIKPIIGMEGYLAPNGHDKKRGKIDSNPRHISLLAISNTGYKNLMQLSTKAFLKGYYYKPRIDYELLEQHREGLVVLSGCLNGDIPKAIMEKRPEDAKRLIEWYLERFEKDHFFLEVQDHPNIPDQIKLNDALISLGKKYNIGLIATSDTHYIHPEDNHAQDVLICVQTGTTVDEKDRMCMLDEDFSLKSPGEVKEAWKEYPEAIDNTQKVADMCDITFEFGKNKLPKFPLPKNQTPNDALKELCVEGLKTRYGNAQPPNAMQRLEYELRVISETGFSSYFLIVSDFVNEAKKRGILVGPGRGSAAGSFVSYLTNITNIDPIKYDLLFERFLNPERVSMPDIDLDFADDRRGEVIDYVREKYGPEHVSQIITFGTMAARAAVRDAGRALGFPYTFCDKISKAIPQFTNFEQALAQPGELKDIYNSDPQAKTLIDMAKKLEGVCRHASTHAAAVVITDLPLTDYAPLQLSSSSDGEKDTVTQYAMSAVESLGLLKMDFLGLKNLTIIQKTLSIIEKRHNIKIDLETLPTDDKPSYQLLQEGKSVGVFQLESSGMRRYLKELKPTEFEDIISMVALYRPGPMDSIPDFIAAKHGRKKITYLHETLKPILEKTYGVIVTQDQVLQIAREFSGFSYAQADILRKAVGKKIKELLDEQQQKFIQGAITTHNVDKKTAQSVWDFIEPFARYGFNRAHAACYAMIAYQTAYLKAHYCAEFMAALLTSDQGNTDRQAIEVADAMSLNLPVLPPDINESEEDFTVITLKDATPGIRFGLSAIKNVGHNAITAIIAERSVRGPYKDLFDIFRRINAKDFNKKSVESLARAGAFDFTADRNHVLANTDALLEFNRALHRKTDAGQKNLFASGKSIPLPEPRITLTQGAPSTQEERLAWEKELLGLYVSEHPLRDFRTIIERIASPISTVLGGSDGSKARIAGVISRVKKIITKSGQPMLFVVLEDLSHSMEVLVFPKMLAQNADIWADGSRIIVDGTLSDKDGETKLLANAVKPLTKDTASEEKTIYSAGNKQTMITITIPASIEREKLEQLKSVLSSLHNTENAVPVTLSIRKGASASTIVTPYRITSDDNNIATLAEIVGPQSVRYITAI